MCVNYFIYIYILELFIEQLTYQQNKCCSYFYSKLTEQCFRKYDFYSLKSC